MVECFVFKKFFPKDSGFRKVDLKFWNRKSLFGVGEGVFDCWTGCIHKCYKCFKLGVRNEKYKNDVRLRNSEMMVLFFFAYERISVAGSGRELLLFPWRCAEFFGCVCPWNWKSCASSLNWGLHELYEQVEIFWV